MKILLTGSSGHLGEAIARTLQKEGQDYLGVDINPSAFTTHRGSITDREFIGRMVQKVDYIIHTATLHKPHVVTHIHQDFVDTNITGTLNLLEEARLHGIKGFIYTSTTSTFGDALTPKPSEPAAWITESTPSIPKNIYGVTNNAAEDLCRLFYRNHKLPAIILKTSRFFPEEDDKKQIRDDFESLNIKAIEYLYRRVDLEDAVSAHLLALEQVERIGFGKFIISATSPFRQADLIWLHADAGSAVRNLYPDFEPLFQERGWKMISQIDRVYVNDKARNELGWQPKYDFRYILDRLKAHRDFRSKLSLEVGKKPYHREKFEKGPYPVEDS